MGLELIVGAILFASAAVAFAAVQKAKRQARNAAENQRGFMVPVRSTTEHRRLLYGLRRLGPLEVHFASSGDNNEFFHYIYLWGEGPITEISRIQFGDEVVTTDGTGAVISKYAGKVRIKHHLGSKTQDADGTAVTDMPGWRDTDRLLGCAYSYIRFKFDEDLFPQGIPDVSAVLFGSNEIRDPRDSTIGYSNNAALCHAHFMTLPKLGPGLNFDTELDLDSLKAAADICDEDVDLKGGGTEKRYTFNGIISLGDDTEQILNTFLTHYAGVRNYTDGKWFFYAGKWVEPTLVVDKRFFVGPVERTGGIPLRDTTNIIRGTYSNESTKFYAVPCPFVKNQDAIDEVGEKPADLDLSANDSPARGTRICQIALRRAQFQRTVNVPCTVDMLRAVPGLPVIFDLPELGFEMVPMMVDMWTWAIEDSKIVITLGLRETDESVYGWDETTDETEVVIADSESNSRVTGGFGNSREKIDGGVLYTDLL